MIVEVGLLQIELDKFRDIVYLTTVNGDNSATVLLSKNNVRQLIKELSVHLEKEAV